MKSSTFPLLQQHDQTPKHGDYDAQCIPSAAHSRNTATGQALQCVHVAITEHIPGLWKTAYERWKSYLRLSKGASLNQPERKSSIPKMAPNSRSLSSTTGLKAGSI